MTITFNVTSKIERVKEPLFQISRARFRAPRDSRQENLETNLLKLDLTRILQQLENLDINIYNNIKFIVGDRADTTSAMNLNDGLSYSLADIGASFDPAPLGIDSIEKMSSQLSRISYKIKRLEQDF
jgi:hypothetical protein